MNFVPGQRWISNAEPELGLGTVVRIDGRNVQVLFATAGVLRHYAMHAAPLARAEFRVGQKVAGQKQSLVVERISENAGLLTYHAGDRALRKPNSTMRSRSRAPTNACCRRASTRRIASIFASRPLAAAPTRCVHRPGASPARAST